MVNMDVDDERGDQLKTETKKCIMQHKGEKMKQDFFFF